MVHLLAVPMMNSHCVMSCAFVFICDEKGHGLINGLKQSLLNNFGKSIIFSLFSFLNA